MSRTSFLIGALLLLADATVSAQGTKWHPGHYLMLDGGATIEQNMTSIGQLDNDVGVKGFMVRLWWYDLEPTFDHYDFSIVDTYLATLRQMTPPKRLVVRIMDRAFKTSNGAGIVPDYLREDPVYNGGLAVSRSGFVARLWEAPVMTRLVKLYQALAERYDSDPLFEGAFTEETTLSFDAEDYPEGYTNEVLEQQYVRFIKTVKPSMPTSNLFLNANWLPGSTDLINDLYAQLEAAHVGAGGSNVFPGRLTLGQSVLTGAYGADYRLELPIASAVENAELDQFTPKEIGDYAYDVLQSHYVFWTRKMSGPTPEQQWFPGILHYLRQRPPTRTRCPNVYGICSSGDVLRAAGEENQPPIVSAGPDTTLQWPEDSVALAGSVSDDGLPEPQLSVGWTQLDGPGAALFTDAKSATSRVRFPSPGTYTLRLTASDGDLSTSDDTLITVMPINQPPQVTAGADLRIQLPTDSVTLVGSVTDDGLPNAAPTLAWSQVSGPSDATFDTTATASVHVSFPSAGSYVLELTANDGELVASDDVTVTVDPPAPSSGSGADQTPTTSPMPAAPSGSSSGGSGAFGPLDLLLLGALWLARARAGRSARAGGERRA